MLSQCINVSTNSDIEKKSGNTKMTILNNIMRQIINKFGTLCWWAPIERASPSLRDKTVMILGVDVHHGKKKLIEQDKIYRQRRSIGGFIATVIEPSGVYKTSCGITIQKAREEIVGKEARQQQQTSGSNSTGNTSTSGTTSSSDSDEVGATEELQGITRHNALKNFIQRVMAEHNVRPDVIIVYRDGVAESQLANVRKFEYEQVRQALPEAKITYFVMQKRVHSKFIIRIEESHQIGNPTPGTVVEDDAKFINYPDFYLVPTKNSLSTVKPVHYVMIHDDQYCTTRELQQITYTMCHLYPNWTDAIKIPFVTQAAHKMAYMLGDLDIEDPEIHQNLTRTYFYL